MGAFPSARKANVIWAGVADDGRLGLAARGGGVETVGEELGFRASAHPAVPRHVTVGRSKGSGVDARAALGAVR